MPHNVSTDKRSQYRRFAKHKTLKYGRESHPSAGVSRAPKFDAGNGIEIKTMNITGAMASITDNAVHFVCERVTIAPKADKQFIN